MYKQTNKSNIISNFTNTPINISDSESDSDIDNQSFSIKNDNNNNNIDINIDNDNDKKKLQESIKKKKENKKNKEKKISTTREYLNYYNEYKNKINKVAVLMCVGIFYEIYALENEGPDVYELADVMDIRVTKKDKSKPEVNEGNPITIGFPIHAITKFMKILHDKSYTVVIVDQIKIDEKTNIRKVTGVYSPSTYIETIEVENKYLATFYIEANPSLNSNDINYCIGMCATDLSIGDIFYYETYDNKFIDGNNAIDEANRFYYYYKPIEVAIYFINNTKKDINLNKILSIIDIPFDKCVFKKTEIDKSFYNVTYQNKLLEKVYKNPGLVSLISLFNLEKSIYSIIALCLTFDFIFVRNKELLNNIKKPVHYGENKFMLLGNGAQFQLDIVEYFDIRGKNKSLYSVINYCKTSMGKRFLKNRLCSPLTDINKINKYYEYTENFIDNQLYNDCRTHLANISDIKKLLHKIDINGIQPYQLFDIYESCLSIKILYEFLQKSSFNKYIEDFITNDDINKLNKSIKYITKTFDITKIKNMNLIDIKESFYNKNVNFNIDEIVNKINGGHDYFEKLKIELSNKFNDTKFHIKRNDRDGYHLTTTRVKGEKIFNCKKDNNDYLFIINDKINIKLSELQFDFKASSCKITCSSISAKNTEMNILFYNLNKVIKNSFISDLQSWNNKYSEMFDKIILFITEIDFIANNAYISNKFHYCKPIISDKNTNESFVIANEMRHPIIERNIQHEYVPHNVLLDENIRGNLIYGVNSCGKSSYMKSVGTNIILAQCGMYVAANEFKYCPFKSLYTRITGNDDMRNGYSSFVVEMNELRNILNNSNKNTLIIGDEICRGTEYLSANSLVAASILKINEDKAKYIFATHLHELSKLDKIKNLSTLKMFHLSVDNINSSEELVFNRKIVEGNGIDDYGINFAKYILNNPDFITCATDIKNDFLKEKDVSNQLLSFKKSNYNKNIIVDSCYLCGSSKKLESHHINFQKDFINDKGKLSHKNKNHIIKNSESNVIVLCYKCHDDLHDNKISINTIVQTTSGIKAI
jgi:DNA mismatch repair protein MutS